MLESATGKPHSLRDAASRLPFTALVTLGISLATVYLLSLFRHAGTRVANAGPAELYAGAVLLIGFGLVFSYVRYDQFGKLLSTLTRWCSAGLAVLLLFEPPDLVLSFASADWQQNAVAQLFWPALLFAVLGYFRPSFVVFAATYLISVRYLITPISGFKGATLDIRYLVEMGQYLSMAAVALYVADRLLARNADAPNWFDRKGLEICIAFNAIAFHFGNYFWSGVAKLAAGPSIVSWIVENETETNIIMAMEKGVFLFAAWPLLVEVIYNVFAALRPFANAFVLVTQFLAIVAVFKRSWIILASLAYDALHIGLFILGGLFFWPWVWINVAVLLAVRNYAGKSIPMIAIASCVLVIVLGRVAGWNHFAYLAWYESNAVRSSWVEAVTEDNEAVRLPSSFFGTMSYTVSHGRIDYGERPGHYSASAWSAMPYSEFKKRQPCVPPADLAASRQSNELAERRLARSAMASSQDDELVRRFVRARHDQVMMRLDDDGRFNPYLRFHHHPSNPWLYPAYNQLDLRSVDHYRLVTQSVCLRMDGGTLDREVFFETTVPIDVH